MTSPGLFTRGSWRESARIADILRRETVGGTILVVAALAALVWANSPWSDAYFDLTQARIGPESLHLDLTVAHWAADGLLAIFFFVVGLELKREFVAGDLSDPRRAALPVVAAMGGMAVPALIFVAFNAGNGTTHGWAIPTATDIAFAVAVLAVLSTHLPSALRTFLLTLAVVDDLLAITVIAVFYTASLDLLMLGAAVIPLALFAVVARRGPRTGWVLIPLALLTWWFMHESGVHATVAGVLLGFTVPARGDDSIAERMEHRVRPVSTGVAVPIFAFTAAGVAVSGDVLADAFSSPVTLGIVAGLVLGKPIGIVGSAMLLSATTKAQLDPSIRWVDVLGVAMLAGIGFTVSLLIGDLAYATDALEEYVKIGVLAGSLTASILAAIVLRRRNRHYRDVEREESVDDDGDGVPDAFQR
ncbi:Na+/H+ antiporter NhaA [Aeromicrobium tamlense]|uniref:Na(+)/H(+) antiporter NhaA n=1 Tax=Aeromicrobium tamlense TaxID=375541 RepID=A0A8I0KFZ2_9ACTN|nr:MULTISPECIES: Na+/H+ antiporter NhaA [Aeromicrobium]MBD1268896.1 Na+/H+ antiporter NhaA [Aeromicrobium tamlense]NYI37197.1 NhaA family Na+:H+ antiporter [Aeromicrobium tamlense]